MAYALTIFLQRRGVLSFSEPPESYVLGALIIAVGIARVVAHFGWPASRGRLERMRTDYGAMGAVFYWFLYTIVPMSIGVGVIAYSLLRR